MEGLLSGRVDVNDVVVSLVELALVRPPPEVGGCIWRNQGLDVALEYVLLFEAIVDKKRKKKEKQSAKLFLPSALKTGGQESLKLTSSAWRRAWCRGRRSS